MSIQDSKDPLPKTRNRRLRWWPALVILLLALPVWGWIWLISDVHRQQKNIHTAVLLFWIVLLQLVWLMFFSRIRWRTRLACTGAIVLAIAIPSSLLEIRGVTGDLLPVLAWRWTPRHTVTVPQEPTTHLDLSLTDLAPAFPQILGPDRNGIVPVPDLATNWETTPPLELWRNPVGPAWAGFAIAANRAVTLEQRGEDELVTCYHLLTGQLLWSHSTPAHFNTTIAGEGPRSVPTISGNKVFTVGATGVLTCLNLTNGSPLWAKNFIEDNNSSIPQWGASGSPLVLRNKVIVCAGGKQDRSLVAYDVANGNRIWSGGTNSAHYSSPVEMIFHETPQILIFNSKAVTSHNTATGAVLWEYPWRRGHPHIATPLSLPDNRVLVSSGYGTGSELLQIDRDTNGTWSATQLWKSIRLKTKFANLIVFQGHIYGLDDGTLVCLELESGELKWKDGRYGHGQMLLANNLILLMAETGDVVLIQPSPLERIELARIQVFQDKTWNPPALAGQYLLVRNDKEAACYRLPLR